MYRVWIIQQHRWIENVPVTEALAFLEQGYVVRRMDLPYDSTSPN